MLSQLRSGLAGSAWLEAGALRKLAPELTTCSRSKSQLRASGNNYWATQARILMREVMAWSAQANSKPDEAVRPDARGSR